MPPKSASKAASKRPALRVAPARITPPRKSLPEVNTNRVVTANHPKLPEEELIMVKRVNTVIKVVPPSPPPPISQQTSTSTSVPQPPSPSPRGRQQVRSANGSSRNPLPRNTGGVFDRRLQARDENVPAKQTRGRGGAGKSKVNFSISCVTISTSGSEHGDDGLEPFAGAARIASAPGPRYESLLTASLREHSSYMDLESVPALDSGSSGSSTADRSSSATLNRSTSTAVTRPSSSSFGQKQRPSLLSLTGPRPFQRKDQRYYDEPIPGSKSRQRDTLAPRAQIQAAPQPFSSESSCPSLSPSSIPIPVRAGRALEPAPLDRPPPERPPQEDRKTQVRPPKREIPPAPQIPRGEGFRRNDDGLCWAGNWCLRPQFHTGGSIYCEFHTCTGTLVDGNRCTNRAYRAIRDPLYNPALPALCRKGFHEENDNIGPVHDRIRAGILARGRERLQKASDAVWWTKVCAVVHPEQYPDIRMKPALYEELFDPDSEDDEPKSGVDDEYYTWRELREIRRTGLINDNSVRPERKFKTILHAQAHPKLKPPPVVVLTAAQEAEFLRDAEGVTILPERTGPPKPTPKLMYTLPPPTEKQPPICQPGWLDHLR